MLTDQFVSSSFSLTKILVVSILVTYHDLVATHVARLDEAERVVDTERRQDADITIFLFWL